MARDPGIWLNCRVPQLSNGAIRLRMLGQLDQFNKDVKARAEALKVRCRKPEAFGLSSTATRAEILVLYLVVLEQIALRYAIRNGSNAISLEMGDQSANMPSTCFYILGSTSAHIRANIVILVWTLDRSSPGAGLPDQEK
ncbi:hypothetical protein An01g10890 [Aspergillus niger]|uniref:Uncharacterized protein n=2 Tax=Aspergillus niger TaxID=5061 RepID=A2QAB7_ASPNC|nr:hypothetical protein An01g10890 [Aspergillus niger]CAK37269.1 hypothetical protein An01g10890 [Aspergillus niger]